MKVLKALFVLLLGLILILNSQQQTLTMDSEDDICFYFPDGAVLRKPGTCDESIICQNGISTPGSLSCKSPQGILLTTGKCGTPKDSYCTDTNCKKNGDEWVADNKNCQDWVKCNGATKVTSGSCPAGQVFHQSLQSCKYLTSDFKCDIPYSICDLIPQDKPFWDENNCHKYLICNKSQKQEAKDCATGTYYDIRSGACIKKAQVDCYKHPYPENVCGTTKLAIRDKFVDDQATCRGYFYCQDKGSGIPDETPLWGQCPVDNFFDADTQTCKPRNYVTCKEDRCDGRANGLELSPLKGCQHYLVCENGYTTDEVKCEDDKYFDPTTKECVNTKISYPICD